MKIAYIGIDILCAALEALLQTNCEIAEIFTCETDNRTEFNTAVIAAARRLGIPCTTKRVQGADLARLKKSGCDAVFCAGYYHRLPVAADLPMVNIHPSHLPTGRGAWPMPVTILRGLPFSGVTIHKITDALDGGDILLQEAFAVSAREDLATITEKINRCIQRIIPRLMNDFYGYYRRATPQSGGEYWRCPTEEDWTITSDMPPEQIDLILRAFYGYECLLVKNGIRYELIGGRFTEKPPQQGDYFSVNGGYVTAGQVRVLRRDAERQGGNQQQWEQ